MIRSLLQEWSARSGVQQAVLCSVVEWKGSVPRKDYPMMLVLSDGSTLGTIGGGSMELQVSSVAIKMMEHSNPQLLDFDMTGKDVHGDMGLCGGTLKVLVEPFTNTVENFMVEIIKQMSSNRKVMIKTSINSEKRVHVDRQLIASRQSIVETDPELLSKLQSIFENQKTKSFEYARQQYLIWQPFTPPHIHIFGAGHVGQSVAELAHFNELNVTVYDDRDKLLTPARFPYAQLIPITFPIIWDEVPVINEQDFVLVASREHKHDRELLIGIFQSNPRYVGLVSSARKWKLLAESLLADGIDPQSVAKVRAPVGLDIDAQTVPEIAISIVSEIIAKYRGDAN